MNGQDPDDETPMSYGTLHRWHEVNVLVEQALAKAEGVDPEDSQAARNYGRAVYGVLSLANTICSELLSKHIIWMDDNPPRKARYDAAVREALDEIWEFQDVRQRVDDALGLWLDKIATEAQEKLKRS